MARRSGGQHEMLSLSVKDIRPDARLSGSLYLRSGEMLVFRGEKVEEDLVEALKRCRVEELVLCEEDEEPPPRPRVPIRLDELREGQRLPADLYDGEGRLVLRRGQLLLQSHVTALKERGVADLLEGTGAGAAEMLVLRQEQARKLIERPPAGRRAHPEGKPVRSTWTTSWEPRAAEDLDQAYFKHILRVSEAKVVLDELASGAGNARRAMELAAAIVDATVEDRFVALASALLVSEEEDFLPEHSVGTALYAAATGAQLGLGYDQAIELTAGALLHDVGMRKVPSWIIRKADKLEPSETLEVESHPRLGAEILGQGWGLPTSALLCALLHHERGEKRGYPYGLALDSIHELAGIVAACDVFKALSSPRPHRPAKSPPEAMATLVRMARAKLLAQEAVRALVEVAGLFPVGIVVRLGTGEVARVVASTGGRPVMRVVRPAPGSVAGEGKLIDGAAQKDVSVKATLSEDEAGVRFWEGM